MNTATIEAFKERGIKFQWSPDRQGMKWVNDGLWCIVVVDHEGGFWSVFPERKAGPDGKKDGPDGALLAKDKPEELVRMLKESGIPDVRLFRLLAQ